MDIVELLCCSDVSGDIQMIPVDWLIIGLIGWWMGLITAAVADYYEKKGSVGG